MSRGCESVLGNQEYPIALRNSLKRPAERPNSLTARSLTTRRGAAGGTDPNPPGARRGCSWLGSGHREQGSAVSPREQAIHDLSLSWLDLLEAANGFEPLNGGFADLSKIMENLRILLDFLGCQIRRFSFCFT